MKVDLIFSVAGSRLPTDHAYSLYGALSRIVPTFHEENSPLRFASISGESDGNGSLLIGERSFLRVRVPDDKIRDVLPLAGKRLDLDSHGIRLGVPSVQTLIPAASLFSRLVTFKNADDPVTFLATARKKLEALGVAAEPSIPIHTDGERAGEAKRRVVRVKGQAIVGYSLIVSQLSADDSLRLQETGLGGRTQIACGFFVPVRGGGK